MQRHGKEESEHLKRHLQDQGSQNPNEVAVFQRISLKFLNSLEAPLGHLGSSSSSSSSDQQAQLTGHTTLAPESGLLAPHTHTGTHPGTINSNLNHSKSTQVTSMSGDSGEYSTALSMTIAIGLSLLVLNVFVFAGVYWKLHRGKQNMSRSRSRSLRDNHKSPSNTRPSRTDGYLDVPQTSFGEKAMGQEFECFDDGVAQNGPAGTICITYAGGGNMGNLGNLNADCCQLNKSSCPGCSNYSNCCSETAGQQQQLCDKSCLAALSVIQEMDEHL